MDLLELMFVCCLVLVLTWSCVIAAGFVSRIWAFLRDVVEFADWNDLSLDFHELEKVVFGPFSGLLPRDFERRGFPCLRRVIVQRVRRFSDLVAH